MERSDVLRASLEQLVVDETAAVLFGKGEHEIACVLHVNGADYRRLQMDICPEFGIEQAVTADTPVLEKSLGGHIIIFKYRHPITVRFLIIFIPEFLILIIG